MGLFKSAWDRDFLITVVAVFGIASISLALVWGSPCPEASPITQNNSTGPTGDITAGHDIGSASTGIDGKPPST